MEEQVEKLYEIRRKYDEVIKEKAGTPGADYNFKYKFNRGVNTGISEKSAGSFIIGDETVSYTIRNVRDKPIVMLSHSFEELDEMLEGRRL